MDIQRYKRGQIWWLKDEVKDYTNHIPAGTRPAIIVSNDSANRFSYNLTVVPCTSADKKELPTHIPLEINGPSTALVENIITVPNSNLGNYIGTCDDKIMEKVDEAILIALGLKQIPEKPDISIDIIPSTLKIKPIEKPKQIKDIIAPTFIDTTSLEEKVSTRKSYEGIGRKGYQKYTKEQMLRFINDCENHTIEWVTKKYNCTSEKATSNKLYRFRKFLKENP